MRGVIRGLVASSGSGCEAVLLSNSTAGQPPCWTTRYSSLARKLPTYCILVSCTVSLPYKASH